MALDIFMQCHSRKGRDGWVTRGWVTRIAIQKEGDVTQPTVYLEFVGVRIAGFSELGPALMSGRVTERRVEWGSTFSEVWHEPDEESDSTDYLADPDDDTCTGWQSLSLDIADRMRSLWSFSLELLEKGPIAIGTMEWALSNPDHPIAIETMTKQLIQARDDLRAAEALVADAHSRIDIATAWLNREPVLISSDSSLHKENS
jgi:hypothetical protein